MLIGKKDTLDYFKKLDKKYFALYKKGTVDTGNAIFRTEEDKESTPEDAYRSFEEIMQMLRTGEYTLIINNDPKVANRGGNRVDFRITMEDSLNSQSKEAIGGVGGVYDTDTMLARAKTMATEEFERLTQKKELDDLKKNHEQLQKDLKEAQNAVQDPWNKLVGAIAPHADSLIGSLIGKPTLTPMIKPAIGSVSPVVTEVTTQHAQEVFEDFVTALQTAKPTEAMEILVKLTTLIKNNPEKFETALNFL